MVFLVPNGIYNNDCNNGVTHITLLAWGFVAIVESIFDISFAGGICCRNDFDGVRLKLEIFCAFLF